MHPNSLFDCIIASEMSNVGIWPRIRSSSMSLLIDCCMITIIIWGSLVWLALSIFRTGCSFVACTTLRSLSIVCCIAGSSLTILGFSFISISLTCYLIFILPCREVKLAH
jgi:hypothetical protein